MDDSRLELTVISANGLQDVNLMFKMDVYVAVSFVGNPKSKKYMTDTHRGGGTSPEWNHRMTFSVPEAHLVKPTNHLLFQIRSDHVFGNRHIGNVCVSINELHDGSTGGERVVEYQVRKPSGEFKGKLKISYKFGQKCSGWWLGSETNVHLCNDKSCFTTYEPVDNPKVFMTANHSAKVAGKGKVEIHFASGKILQLHNVLHVQEMEKNFVSTSLLCKIGIKVVFEDAKVIMSKKGIFVGKGYVSDGYFKLSTN